MSRNGSGTYSAPVNSWNPQTAGVSATAADFGALLTDLAAALTQSVSADGQTAVTGNIAMGGNKLTGLGAGNATGNSLRWEQLFSQGIETDIASATTTDIGGQNTNFLRVTGTTAITSFGTNYNGPRFLRFAAALTLTHDATALILPGAANITTAAGDVAIVVPKASGGTANGWQVFYQRAALAPGVASSLPVSITSSGLTQATSRILGRVSGGGGAIEELTGAQVSAFAAAATDTAQGAVELATTAEAQAGTDTTRALTPATMQAAKIIPLTAVTASGTAVDFTGIPSWATRVTIVMSDVSTNGTSSFVVRIGNGSFITSGYPASYSIAATSTNTVQSTNTTTGFAIFYSAATDTVTGTMTLIKQTGNTWVSTHMFNRSGWSVTGGGYYALSGALDRVRITSISADTFDGGTINVLYE